MIRAHQHRIVHNITASHDDAGPASDLDRDPGSAPEDAALATGIDTAWQDDGVRPQDDYFRSWFGRWLDEFEIPADKAQYGAFAALHDVSQEQLKAIITELSEDAAADADTGEAQTPAQQIAILYRDFMDEEALRAAGLAPLADELAAIDRVTDAESLADLLGRFDRDGIGGPVGSYVHQDNKDATRYLLDLRQSGLSLPDRDFYLTDQFAQVREAYVEHIVAMLELAGWASGDEAKATAERILAFETRLAEAQWDKVRNRDPEATYNLRAVDALAEISPDFDLGRVLAGAHASSAAEVNIGQPDYFTALSGIVAEGDFATWREYLRWKLLSGTAALLGPELDAANFAFYGTVLSGVPEQRPRWKRGVSLVDSALGEALGQEYVTRHFPPQNKERMVELVDNLLATYAESIDGLEWMGESTKDEARAKLATFRAKIGYPDVWRDYSALRLEPGDLVGNARRAARFEHDREVGKLGGPIDREEWFMPPQMVNAYYNPEMNEIVFPAAILQPPFFDMGADDAVNYGGIGAVIGHEISHGFDDKGSQYDGLGNLRNWWTAEDAEAFATRTAALVEQYGAYEVAPGHPVNGKLTLGENIADVSGLAVAYRAYVRSLGGDIDSAPVIDGLTGAQRFFAGWAQVWRTKTREAEAIRQVTIDPHSPPRFRVLGALVNNDDFMEVIGVAEGDGMWRDPADRVRIW